LKKKPSKSPYDRAKSESTFVQAMFSIIGLLVMLFGIATYTTTPFLLKTTGGIIANPRFEAAGLFLGILIAASALYAAAASSTRIAVFQMEQARDQAEAQRSTDLALANAIAELTKELRRRPDTSSSVVTFSLFGPSSLIRPAPESPSGIGNEP
jgi:hypothetical protein